MSLTMITQLLRHKYAVFVPLIILLRGGIFSCYHKIGWKDFLFIYRTVYISINLIFSVEIYDLWRQQRCIIYNYDYLNSFISRNFAYRQSILPHRTACLGTTFLCEGIECLMINKINDSWNIHIQFHATAVPTIMCSSMHNCICKRLLYFKGSQTWVSNPLSKIVIQPRPFSLKAWCHLPSNMDVLGLGLPSDNNFQPITSLVSLAMLGNKIVVSVTLLGYGGKHATCCLWEWKTSAKPLKNQPHAWG